ncbi:MAG: hypothetical protein SFH39_08615 [Candidatus Magnetobacterium sp. LHC-1]|nr:hypothetical protein [Nitrospirota bacterium]
MEVEKVGGIEGLPGVIFINRPFAFERARESCSAWAKALVDEVQSCRQSGEVKTVVLNFTHVSFLGSVLIGAIGASLAEWVVKAMYIYGMQEGVKSVATLFGLIGDGSYLNSDIRDNRKKLKVCKTVEEVLADIKGGQ